MAYFATALPNREHLYELRGFKALLGDALLARVLAGEEVTAVEFPELPNMSVRLAFERPCSSLEDLVPTIVDCANGVVSVMLDSKDGLVSVLFALDFPAERLHFDFAQGLGSRDDGTKAAAIHSAAILRFKRRYIGNGSLEIWIAGKRISRREAYLPENTDMSRTDANYERMIAAADELVAQREP